MSTRILVTGGASGLGAALVRALVGAGHDVAFTYRSSGEAAEALVSELAAAHPARMVTAHALDLADRTALDAFCESLEDEAFYGLVHNAGQSSDALAAMLDQDRAEAAMQVNFWSLTRIAKSLMRGMIRAPVTGAVLPSRSSNSTSDRHATSAPRTFATPSKARERWCGNE